MNTFIYSWMVFIFFISVSLKIYLCKKYKDVIDIFAFRSNWFWHLDTVSLKPLRGNKDKRVKKVYILILGYKMIYFSGIAIFILLNIAECCHKRA